MHQDQQKRFYRICPTYKEVPLYNNKIGVMIDVRANDSIWFAVDKLQTILSFAAESRKSFNSQREIEKKTVDAEPVSQSGVPRLRKEVEHQVVKFCGGFC